MSASSAPTIRLVRAAKIVDLRHRILRQGLPREEAMFDGDDEPAAVHFAAEVDGRIIGCATLMPEPWDQSPAWRLRGMAVDNSVQQRGVGSLLLSAVHDHAAESSYSHLLWCNARCPAIPFYKKNGWRVVSEIFDIPTAGPHVKMIRGKTATNLHE